MTFVDTTLWLMGEPIIIPAYVKQTALAVFFGFLIGAERGWHKKVASYRTFSIIATGSCLFTILSVTGAPSSASNIDLTRIASQIVTGIGFVGAGVIFKSGSHVEGITTAALIWLAGAIGMACGFNHPALALVGFVAFLAVEFLALIIRRIQVYSPIKIDGKEDEKPESSDENTLPGKP